MKWESINELCDIVRCVSPVPVDSGFDVKQLALRGTFFRIHLEFGIPKFDGFFLNCKTFRCI